MAHLSLAWLGTFQVNLDGAPITAFETDKVRALLVYLSVEAGRPHRRETLTGLLWPDMPEASARHNLSQCLFNLRQVISDRQAEPPFLLISRETLQFNSASRHTLDVAVFNRLLDVCEAHPHLRLETCPVCIPQLQQAVELYQGDFLPQLFLEDSTAFEEWVLVQRERLHRRALAALAGVTDYHEQRGDYAAAIRLCHRQLELDPWREESHRQMMRLLAWSGQRSAALAQYESCRRILAAELRVEPSPETRTLYEEIRAGRYKTAGEKPEEKLLPPPRPAAPLPTSLTPFLGRERELAELGHLLVEPTCRLITLVGPGGIGKTRLALQAAANWQTAFALGAAFVSLAPLTTSDLLIPTVADAVGFTFYGSTEPKTQLLNYLREKELLLVLDNFEHLLPPSFPPAREEAEGEPAGQSLVRDILQSAPRIKALVTSREPLYIQGEWLFEVEGLGDQAPLLFAQSARRARAGFAVSPKEQPEVERICRLVDNMPLGVELAASWVRVLSCAEIAHEIERNLDFLSASTWDAPERHRSIRAVFDHSWRLLSAEERQGMQRLSVFRGGFQREAAEQVAGVSLGLLSALVSKSLLRRTTAGRYDLHELIRQYVAVSFQEEARAERTARDRHAAYYLTLLQSHEPALFSPRQKESLAELNAEIDNLRAAWEEAVAQRKIDLIRQTAVAIWYFYNVRNYFQEGELLFKRAANMVEIWPAALETDAAVSERAKLEGARGDLLARQAYFVRRQGRNSEAASLYQASLAFLRRHHEPVALAWTLPLYGALCWIVGEFEEARRYLQESLALSQALKNEWLQALCLALLGMVAHEQGAYAEAYRLLSQAMARFRASGDPHIITFTLNFFSRTAQALGRTAEVQDLLREGLQLTQETGDRFGMALMFERLAVVAQAGKEEGEARRLVSESIGLYREVGDPWSLSRALNLLGHLALAVSDMAQARESFNQALHTAISAQVIPGALDALAGLATLLAQEGHQEEALTLVAHILAHPSSTQEAKDRAEQLRPELEARLTFSQIEAARQCGQSRTLELIVAEVLKLAASSSLTQ